MKRKRGGGGGGGPNWLDTYADMVTLLLTFFVLLFSMSSVNAEKWEVLVKSLSGNGATQRQIVINGDENDPGEGLIDSDGDNLLNGDNEANESVVPDNPEDITDFNQLYYYLKSYVEKNNLESDVEVSKGEGFTFIAFRNNIFFSGDSAVLQPQGKSILDILSRALANVDDQIKAIKFEGHTARARDQETPNQIDADWQLSAMRAVNVLTYVYKKDVIDPQKLSATGHGEHDPIVPHDGTEATRIKNRRVEIYIAQEGKDELTLNEVYEQLNSKNNN